MSSVSCGAETPFDFRISALTGAPDQAARREGLSARIRFARANSIFSFAVCFRRPRYRVFRYLSCPLTISNTCSTFALTDDFSCSLRLTCACEHLEVFLCWDGLRLTLYLFFLPCLFFTTASSRFHHQDSRCLRKRLYLHLLTTLRSY